MSVSEEDIRYLSVQLENRLSDIQRENAMLIEKLSDYKNAQKDALRVNRQLYRRLMQQSSEMGAQMHRNGGSIGKQRGALSRRSGISRGRKSSPSLNVLGRMVRNPPDNAPLPMEGNDDVDLEDMIEPPNTSIAQRQMLTEQRRPFLPDKNQRQELPQQQIIVMQRKSTETAATPSRSVRICQPKVELKGPSQPILNTQKLESPLQQRSIIPHAKMEPKIEELEQDSPPEIPTLQIKKSELQQSQQSQSQRDVKPVVRTVTPLSKPSTVSTVPQVVVQVAQSSSLPQPSSSPQQTSKQRLETAFKAFAKRTGPIIQQEFVAAGNATLNQRTLALELVSRWQKLPDDERKSYFVSL